MHHSGWWYFTCSAALVLFHSIGISFSVSNALLLTIDLFISEQSIYTSACRAFRGYVLFHIIPKLSTPNRGYVSISEFQKHDSSPCWCAQSSKHLDENLSVLSDALFYVDCKHPINSWKLPPQAKEKIIKHVMQLYFNIKHTKLFRIIWHWAYIPQFWVQFFLYDWTTTCWKSSKEVFFLCGDCSCSPNHYCEIIFSDINL